MVPSLRSWRCTLSRVLTRSSGYVAVVEMAVPVAPEMAWPMAGRNWSAGMLY